MVPPSIQRNLAGLRIRERMLSLVWGAACCLAVAIVLLLLSGFIDWFIDRGRDTPFSIRLGLFGIQAVVALVAGLLFVLLPQLKRLSDTTLALWVEEKIRVFDHRLISAVQFNEPGAKIDGMSRELIALVTKEAEKQSDKVAFAQVADHSRLKWSAFVLTPILLIALIPFAVWPGTASALFARQFLMNVEIPHSITLESISPAVWPIGDTIPIRYRASGAVTEELIGEVFVAPTGQASDTYQLAFIQWDGAEAIFGADIPASTADIRYSARMLDGRTRLPSDMKMVPRPVVMENQAWVKLPAYCGLRPDVGEKGLTIDERRYESPQGRGDVVGIPGSGVRVRAEAQKRIQSAWLVVHRAIVDIAGQEKPEQPKEETVPAERQEQRKIAMKVGSAFNRAKAEDTKETRSDTVVKAVVTSTPIGADDKQTVTIQLFVNDGCALRSDKLKVSFTGSEVAPAALDIKIPAGTELKTEAGTLVGHERSVTITAHLQRAKNDLGLLKLRVQLQAVDGDKELPSATIEFDEVAVAEGGFDLLFGMTSYQVVVVDHHQFDNRPPPRRSLRIVPEDPPQVMLLRDTFGKGAEFDVEGLPVVLGGRIRVPYVCYHPYGLGKARLLYRMVKKHESGNEPPEEEPWVGLGLPEVNPDVQAGPFDSKTGMFMNTDAIEGSIGFHAVPSSRPQTDLGRTLGGGRYLLSTKGLINAKGLPVDVKSGDMIEYCVEVYAAHREPAGSTPFARSETRVSTVMSITEFLAWREAITREDESVKRLEKNQKGIFDR